MWLALFLLSASRPALGCTTIGVTAGASSKGSTMVSSTADCIQCDSRVAYIAPKSWPAGALRPIYDVVLEYPREVSDRSPTYHPEKGQRYSVPLNYIPQVPRTYGYWEALYGFQNEHGLSLGETTGCSYFPVSKENMPSATSNGTAHLYIRPLTQLAMERCKTARCAVETMGALAERYGFYGESGGGPAAGEALNIADGRELWIFHITSDPTQRSAFWAAMRVPDGHVVVMANNFVLREVDCEDSENFLCSTDLYAKTHAAGLWDGRGKLDWLKSLSPDIRNYSYTVGFAPIPYYTMARMWRVQSRVAPSLNIKLTDDPYALASSVPADNAVSHRTLMDLNRDHYEGTEIDMTVGAAGGPFGSPNRVEYGQGLAINGGQFARAISIPRTSFATLGETFADVAGRKKSLDKLWWCSDAPASCVYVPFYANTSGFDESYRTGHMGVYNDASAWWVFDFVANWMNINYRMMAVDVHERLQELQDLIDEKRRPMELAALQQLSEGHYAAAFESLSRFQSEIQNHVVNTWRNFGRFLIMKYNDGNINHPKIAEYTGYPAWWLEGLGVNNDIRPKWMRPSQKPPSFWTEYGPGPYEKLSRGAVSSEPGFIDARPYIHHEVRSQTLAATPTTSDEEPAASGILTTGVTYVVGLVTGLLVGPLRAWWQRPRITGDHVAPLLA